jgi:hypothetical protein
MVQGLRRLSQETPYWKLPGCGKFTGKKRNACLTNCYLSFLGYWVKMPHLPLLFQAGGGVLMPQKQIL